MTELRSPITVEVLAWQRPLQAFGLLLFLALAGYLVADLVSGIVHFLADNFGSDTTPFFGPGSIRPFRDHHVNPLGILTHGFVAANGNNALVSIHVLAPVALLLPVSASAGAHLVGSFSCS